MRRIPIDLSRYAQHLVDEDAPAAAHEPIQQRLTYAERQREKRRQRRRLVRQWDGHRGVIHY